MRHRPIRVGVQGQADTFMALRMPFNSQAAKELNIKIFENIYHGAFEASNELAAKDGTYETWMGSPAQLGQLQFDLWSVTPTDLWDVERENRQDWSEELAFGRPHAYCVDESNIGQQ